MSKLTRSSTLMPHRRRAQSELRSIWRRSESRFRHQRIQLPSSEQELQWDRQCVPPQQQVRVQAKIQCGPGVAVHCLAKRLFGHEGHRRHYLCPEGEFNLARTSRVCIPSRSDALHPLHSLSDSPRRMMQRQKARAVTACRHQPPLWTSHSNSPRRNEWKQTLIGGHRLSAAR